MVQMTILPTLHRPDLRTSASHLPLSLDPVASTYPRPAAPPPLPLFSQLLPIVDAPTPPSPPSDLQLLPSSLHLHAHSPTLTFLAPPLLPPYSFQASWSRLEGLLLHWACTYSRGSAWAMPPSGWSAIPSKTADCGERARAGHPRVTHSCLFRDGTMKGSHMQHLLSE